MSNEFPTCPFCGATAYPTHGGGVYCDNPQCGASTVSPAAWKRRALSPAVKALKHPAVIEATRALRVIRTWATFDLEGGYERKSLDPRDVANLTEKALKTILEAMQ